jgi:sirohydrochlorin ferrochelatase
VAHGSRDPRFQLNLQRLAGLVTEQLENKPAYLQFKNDKKIKDKNEERAATKICPKQEIQSCLVGTACLELTPIPLHESIEQFSQIAARSGWQKLKIVPLFLSPGVHVEEDIPAEVDRAREMLGGSPILELCPHLGSRQDLRSLLARQFENLAADADARIVLAHGSRRPSANHRIETLALELNAVAAYWSVEPQLTERVEELVNKGAKKIAILPYFLFSGGITEAIAAQAKQLQVNFPKAELIVGQPLGASTELAKIIIDGMR